MRNRVKVVLLTILLLFTAIPVLVSKANDDNGDSIDFVLLIDNSGTMNLSDPERLGAAAAKMFIDLLPMNNAKVGVITFGAKSDTPYAAKTQEFSDTDFSYTCFVSDLVSASSDAERSTIKKAIDQSTQKTGGATYIRQAIDAAADMLTYNNSTSKDACIIIMSDGRDSNRYNAGYTTGIDETVNYLRDDSRQWPIYALELNYDKLNDYSGSDARKLLEDITSRTGGSRVEVKNADEIVQEFASIFAKYIEMMPVIMDLTIGQQGQVTHKFDIPDLASEANFVITGTEFTKISICDPNGDVQEFGETIDTGSRRFVWDRGKYASLKLIRPVLGEWSVTVFGDAGEKVMVQIISAHEMDITMTTNPAPDANRKLSKNSTISVGAFFEYNGEIITSETFYPKNPAYVIVRDESGAIEKYDMTGTKSGYKADIQLTKAGRAAIYVVIENGMFRNGKKVSREVTYDVYNEPVTAVGNFPDITLNVNATSDPMNISQYFNNPDGDKLYLEIITPDGTKDETFSYELDEDNRFFTLMACQKDGSYDITINAMDADMKAAGIEPATQRVHVNVLNNAPLLTDKLNNIEFIGAGPFNNSLDSVELFLNEHFSDPDGLPLIYSWKVDNESATLEFKPEGDSLTLVSNGTYSCKVTITAMDSCGSAVSDTFRVVSHTWFAWVLSNYWWALVAIGALILIILSLAASKHVRGSWTVKIYRGRSNVHAEFRSLTAIRNKYLRKSKFDLIYLLNAAIRQDESTNLPENIIASGSVELLGSVFTRQCTVKIKRGGITASCNGRQIEGVRKVKMRPNSATSRLELGLSDNEDVTQVILEVR